jgi:hypothetical protein
MKDFSRSGDVDAAAEPIPPVVQMLADRLVQALGSRLVGVYLGGSASMGDFVAASSDYDVLVVTEGALTAAELDVLDTLHQHLLADDPDAARLEGDYAPRHLLVPQGTSAPVPSFGSGRLTPDEQEIMLSADNIANIRESSIAVYGPPASTVLPTVTPVDVRAAVLEMLQEGPDHADSERDAAAEVLNLVRSLRALETGRPTTKSEGVAWALAHLDTQWHEIVRQADRIRRGAAVSEDDTQMRSALSTMDHALRPRPTNEG